MPLLATQDIPLLGQTEVRHVRDAEPEGMETQLNRALAEIAASGTPNVADLLVGGAGAGHTFTAALVSTDVEPIGAPGFCGARATIEVPGTQSFPDSVPQVVTFSSIVENDGGFADLPSDGFTVPTGGAGTYLLTGQIILSTALAVGVELQVFVNGVQTRARNGSPPIISTGASVADTVQLQDGDFVQLQAVIDHTSAVTIVGGSFSIWGFLCCCGFPLVVPAANLEAAAFRAAEPAQLNDGFSRLVAEFGSNAVLRKYVIAGAGAGHTFMGIALLEPSIQILESRRAASEETELRAATRGARPSRNLMVERGRAELRRRREPEPGPEPEPPEPEPEPAPTPGRRSGTGGVTMDAVNRALRAGGGLRRRAPTPSSSEGSSSGEGSSSEGSSSGEGSSSEDSENDGN